MLTQNIWQYKGFWSIVIIFVAIVTLIGVSKPNPSHNFETQKQLYTAQQLYLESQ